MDSLFNKSHPYDEILLAKCDEIAALLALEIEDLDLPVTLSSGLNPKNIYHAFLTLESGGKRIGGVSIWFSPKKGTFKITTDKTSDPLANQLYQTITEPQLNEEKEPDLAGWHIYTDGSFNGTSAAWAYVILQNGEKKFEAAGLVTNEEHTSSWQIIGEFTAVIHALVKCDSMSISEATLHYDLDLIGKIATGRYNAKAPVSQFYLQSLSKTKVAVNWNKVKAHSGVKWNEYVDKLATKALIKKSDLDLDSLFLIEFSQ